MATYRCPERLASSPSRGDQALYRACEAALCHLNIVLDTQLAADLADAAVRRAFAKQGRPVPHTLLAPPAGSSAAATAAAGNDGRAVDAAASVGATAAGSGSRAGGLAAGAVAAGYLRTRLATAADTSQAAELLHTADGVQLLLLGVVIGTAAWGLLSWLLPRGKDGALALPLVLQPLRSRP